MKFIDQMNHRVELFDTPKRIVSVVPSQTELLYCLGLHKEVVGITKFCIHPPEWFMSKRKVGGTKTIDIEKVKALNPDLIIGNKEENSQEQIEELMDWFPVWMSDISTLADACDMIVRVGKIMGKQQQSIVLKLQIEQAFRSFLDNFLANNNPGRVAYFIWKKPYMVVGTGTFISHMLECCGFKNVFSSDSDSRYPEVNLEQLTALQPQYIFLSSEPYPFKEKHVEEFSRVCPLAKILIVDGEIFSWYGSRLLKAPAYFRQLMENID